MKFRKRIRNPDQLPLFVPESSWTPLETLPDLSRAEYIAIDTETYDPKLQEAGPGFIRGDAHVVGISLATEIGHKFYMPIAHREGNMDKQKVIEYLKYTLKNPAQQKIAANAMYDLEALDHLGVEIKGDLHDIQIAEPILDENKSNYTLEALSWQYLGIGKNESLLEEAEWAFGVEHKKGMHHLPAKFAAPYAEDDADNTLQIFMYQLEEMKADNVFDIYNLEKDLMPILYKMRKRGVRVDVSRAEQVANLLRKEEAELYEHLRKLAGRAFNPNSPSTMVPILQERGIDVPRNKPTEKNPLGSYSVTNDWLGRIDDEFTQGVNTLRKTTKMRSDFIEGFIIELSVNGRLHTQWHQLREFDEEQDRSRGTRSGRIASSKPNLTQIPSRDPKWGPLIRSLFIADQGGFWCKADYSQQEPRTLLHFAYIMRLAGAAEARQSYIDNPLIDYHQLVNTLIFERSGRNIGRGPAKTINLGAAYGMGKRKLASDLGLSMEKAEEILEVYHSGVPYVKLLEKACMERVDQKGFIRTILGRKRRFPTWEPRSFELKYRTNPVATYEEAVQLWGYGVERAHKHKALNGLVQGSAADQIKKCIILLDAEDLAPQIQVYDELNNSLFDHSQVRRMQEIMEHAIPQYTIPFDASPDLGESWGKLTPYRWDGNQYNVVSKK